MAVLLWISRQSTYDSRQVWNSVIVCGQKDPHRNWFKVTFVFFDASFSRYSCFYLLILKSFESEFFICWSKSKAKAIRLCSMTPSWLVPASASHCESPQHRCETLRCQNLLWLAYCSYLTGKRCSSGASLHHPTYWATRSADKRGLIGAFSIGSSVDILKAPSSSRCPGC